MYLPKASLDAIEQAVTDQQPGAGEMMMILLGDAGRPDLGALVERLRCRGIWFFGGFFSGLIHDAVVYEGGALILKLPARMKPVVVRGLDRQPEAPPDLAIAAAGQAESAATAIVFVDGFAANIALFLAELYDRWGSEVHYLGAGAGSLSLKQQPCVFTQDGVFQDAAVVAVVAAGSSIGVRHGWRRLAGPVVATQTRRNVIAGLNWRNAFAVYRETVEADAHHSMAPQNFYDVAKEYPFGLLKEGQEDVVRDPIAVNAAGELICVGEIPEHAALNVLKGRPEWLIAAADQAALACRLPAGALPLHSLVMDCISRRLFMGARIADELGAIQRRFQAVAPSLPLEGALTLGEIASYGEGYLEYFNKTVVTGLLYQSSRPSATPAGVPA